jgi:hypothetical protein
MTTFVDARSELEAAIEAGGVRAVSAPGGDPPYALIAGDGTGDPARVVTGQLVSAWRITMVGGAADDERAATELDIMKTVILTAILELDGWRFTAPIGRDGSREWGGILYLQADAFAERLIDL